MSHTTYNKQWSDAQVALSDLLVTENIKPESRKPEKDKNSFFQLLATMYVRYIQIFRRLEQCYDQIVHPQKRLILRHTLDGVIGRLLELKHEMINNDFHDFHYFDDVITDLKLTPADIEIPIPKYYTLERANVLKEREKFLTQILARIGFVEKPEKEDIKMSISEAIRYIQVHERARQGRQRAKFMREISKSTDKTGAGARGAPTMDPNIAATKIAKVWRGVMARRRVKKIRDEEFTWLGMTPQPPPSNPKNTAVANASRIEAHRRLIQNAHEQEYQQALTTIKDKLREQEGAAMREMMMDQLRQWFVECRDATGKFPDFPDEEDGGSASIFKERDPAQLAAELAEREESGGGGKKGKKSGKKSGKKDKKKSGKKSGKGKKGKKGKDDDEDEGFKLAPSQFVDEINNGTKSFNTVWQHREEAHNFAQKYDAELIREEKRTEVESEIRLQVDELMREELKNLKMAVDKDKGKKKSGKKKKKKKKSGKKGKKKKKAKDLTPDKTMEELFEELVVEGVIKKYPRVQLSEYLGEYSYLATTLRQANSEPQPSLSDVRRVVTEFAILPLGSQAVHEKSPLVRSLMLVGPSGVGKNMLLNAICTEVGACLFDLTATNIAGKYPGKDGLKMLIHLVFKVSKGMQPSVILVDSCEKMFIKKAPKGDATEPKRLKKVFPKELKKQIEAEDRILLVGLTRSPWDADKGLISLYQKILLIPRPDYASRFLIWRSLITKANGIITSNLDISSLTKISDGYTMGQMATACNQVLTERRIAQMSKKPLQAIEFVQPLSKMDPIYKEEEEDFKKFYESTPLGKKRKQAAKGDEEDGGKGGKGKGKKGKGKKGKKKK